MNKPLLVIGMSPGNSYFKQEVINKLLVFSLGEYENIEILIPDVPAISTYVALGYPENIARKEKAIPQGNAFRNRLVKAIEQESLDGSRIHIGNWRKDEIEENIEYQTQYLQLKDLYQNNEDFRKDINKATSDVLLENPFKKKDITISDIEIGTHYIISEFAYMLSLPILKKDFNLFVYGYHKPWPVWEKFIEGEYDGKKREDLGFLLLPSFIL
ncbi:MAG: tRNA-dependent cyclodipeptide synthase [Candidatus Pacebacteria bacterium]|nr:tRNA-dependent cyclodipeptide synthase [Candidatus Paceibacterota bacterium]